MRDDREELDEVMGALVKRLQVMPASDPRMRAAILARVRGRRQAPWRATLAWVWQPSVPMLAAATLAVAAIALGYAGRVLVEPVTAVAYVPAPVVTLPVTAVSNELDAVRPVPQQFVLQQHGANRVRLVGDFNGWGATPVELSDPTHSGVWEVTVALRPGRHTFAYLVDDSSSFVLDPRMPKTTDRDFGRTSSVILVNDR